MNADITVDKQLLSICEKMLTEVEDKTSFEAEIWKDAIKFYKNVLTNGN